MGDLFAWKPALRINLFAEEFIWQNGKLYKEVKNGVWQPETTKPYIPGPYGPIYPQPAIQQPGVYIGDVPGWYVTWSSNNSGGANLNNDQFLYTTY